MLPMKRRLHPVNRLVFLSGVVDLCYTRPKSQKIIHYGPFEYFISGQNREKLIPESDLFDYFDWFLHFRRILRPQ